MNAEQLIQRMMFHFNLFSMNELANKIGISQPAISKWKKANSILAIQKKCRELGIYDEIFTNSNVINLQNSTNDVGVRYDTNSNDQNIKYIGNKSNIDEDTLNIDEDTLNLMKTIYHFAKRKNKVNELNIKIHSLMPEFM